VIYLRFITDQWNLESRLIRFGSRWWCSHVEFVRTDTSGVAIDTLGSHLGDGVQIRPYNYCKPTREEWWFAPRAEDAYNMAKAVIGARYDALDILGFTFARDWHKPGNFICSELVDWAFKKVNAPLTNLWMPSHRVSPRDLLVSPTVTFVKRVV
jgi:hypothetical protein